ncbi:MAG: hypothetical protein AAF933_02570 [Pseudomonadota bacterium]
MHLLLFDTAGIQPYIFRSNRLRENLGASHLVAQATGPWVVEAVRALDARAILPAHPDRHLEHDDDALLEVVYTAGGNALVLARSAAVAEALVRRLSTRLLTDAPGLRLIASTCPFDFRTHALAETVGTLIRDLARQKREDAPSEPLLGLAVTRACRATGHPAVGQTRPWGTEAPTFVSAEVLAKLNAVQAANRALAETFAPGERLGRALAYPTELDALGRSHGDTSLLAVVHADGDGMGARFRQLGREYAEADQNRAYIAAFRALSRRVDTVARAALDSTLDALRARIHSHPKDPTRLVIEHRNEANDLIQRIELVRSGAEHYLPVRPIVSGGDDLTLVCDGRLGLSLTTHYLTAFAEAARAHGLDGVTASAGVALVKSRYPFARAYHLAEQLARSAKDYRRALGEDAAVGCLDWHLSRTTLYDDARAMRAREYQTPYGLLTLRPLALDAHGDVPPARTWPTVAAGISGFQGAAWHARRNKTLRLREALREGPAVVKQVMAGLNAAAPARQRGSAVELPALPGGVAPADQSGWTSDKPSRALYFDALELADLHVPLGPAATPGASPDASLSDDLPAHAALA